MLTDTAVSSHVFPARAGMSRDRRDGPVSTLGFPRPRGDEPPWFALVPGFTAFSPPARG